MAKTMTGGASAPAKRGRGRPPGSGKKDEGAGSASSDTAPGLGHNQPDEGVFLAWVQRLRRHDEKIAESKAATKVLTNIRKDIRKEAGAAGLVMGDLDEALEDLAKERADLASREERRRLYRTWLNLPVGGQQNLDLTHAADPGAQKALWVSKANTAGRLGENCPIDGCPPELIQDVEAAWRGGQTILMKASKLLGAAFAGDDRPAATATDAAAANGEEAQSPAPAPAPETFAQVLVLDGSAFPGMTDVDDCNLKTLLEAKRPAWAAAETVIVILAGKKRILKEPAADEAEAYEDTGEDGVPLSEVEEAAPADIAALQGVEAPNAHVEEPAPAPVVDPVVEAAEEAQAQPEAAPEAPADLDLENLDDDPDNWFADMKTAVREWLRANPDAVLKHPGLIAFAQSVATADRTAGAGGEPESFE